MGGMILFCSIYLFIDFVLGTVLELFSQQTEQAWNVLNVQRNWVQGHRGHERLVLFMAWLIAEPLPSVPLGGFCHHCHLL